METAAVEPVKGDQPSCWCCGTVVQESALTRFGAHPEVGVCAGCAHWLNRRARLAGDHARRTPGATVRRGIHAARVAVMRAGIHDWPLVGPLLRRVDRHLP